MGNAGTTSNERKEFVQTRFSRKLIGFIKNNKKPLFKIKFNNKKTYGEHYSEARIIETRLTERRYRKKWSNRYERIRAKENEEKGQMRFWKFPVDDIYRPVGTKKHKIVFKHKQIVY